MPSVSPEPAVCCKFCRDCHLSPGANETILNAAKLLGGRTAVPSEKCARDAIDSHAKLGACVGGTTEAPITAVVDWD